MLAVRTNPTRQRIVVVSQPEQHIYANVLRKESEALDAAESMVRHVAEYEREEIMEASADKFTYATLDESGEGWDFKLGDSCERLAELDDETVGLSVFSPPFESLYTYSPTERDLGNSASSGEFWTTSRGSASNYSECSCPAGSQPSTSNNSPQPKPSKGSSE